ncbi:TetR family transcriptional regulator [Pseudomonas reidholzensis]|uniref:TetR family transcriptional regulator n=1 Tax=Pseudomonas reidholzensis TaxID=1785162 RepID=A0A383RYQ5_9PSED|nr:TetR/AcrR family transcriptional regulator [Pseudomonas reidholzensis]SYX91764.1 TetR family transcriptional regulator [Pseudomonas reidholzensis]
MSVQDHDSESSSTPATKRRRAPKGEMRRAALLDAATTVFAKDGYGAASMRDVAEIAGITTVGLLHHFPNKVSLLRALLDRRDQRVTEQFATLEMAPTLENFLAFVRMSMRFSVHDLRECQAAMMISVESLSEQHPAWPWYKEKFELTHAHAQAHLGSLVECGEIAAHVDVKLLATEIFAVMDGLQLQWLRDPEQVDVEAAFDAYLQRLAPAIRA